MKAMAVETNYWTRKSPYFQASLRAGCGGFAVANHMYQPHSYGDPLEEYRHLTEGVTLWDVATERQVEITGPDALRFTELLTPRDVSACPVGRGRYIVVTSEDGGIVNDPVLFRLSEQHFWLSASDSDLILWAKGIAVFAEMEVAISEPDVSPVQIQGPKSPGVIEALFGERGQGLRFYEIRALDLDGIPVMLSRSGWSGEVGFEIFLRDSRHAEDLWARILDAGRPHGIAVTGPSDIRRVEAGILGYGCDISLDTNPYEASLDWMLEPEKAQDFIGKAALRRIKQEGVARRLVGIELACEPLPSGSFEDRWPAFDAGQGIGEEIGEVTVALYSPRLEKNIGYAMVQTRFAALGASFDVEMPTGRARASVAKKPFIVKSG
jgi:aminomethyltransferase